MIVSLLSVSMVFSMLAPLASASEKVTPEPAAYSETVVSQMVPFLNAIESISYDLLELGDSAAITQYFRSQNIDIIVYNEEKGERPRVKRGWWGCSLAIGEWIVLTSVPVSKITKVKRYIEALGGLKEATKLLVGATSVAEKTVAIRDALAGLIAELVGITEVKEKCFD